MSIPTVAFNQANTIIPRKSYVRLIPNNPAISATGLNATDIFTATGHGLVNGMLVLISGVTGLTGLTAGVYYVVAVATNTFQLSATLGGVAVNYSADGSCTLKRIADLVGKNSNYKQTTETIKREIPDADGLLRPDRIVAIKRMQNFEFETEEIAALPPAFGGTTDVSGNLTTGTAQLYITDPDDAAGTAAIVTQQFNATWMLADGYNFAAGTVTVAKIIIESLEKVILTIDGTA